MRELQELQDEELDNDLLNIPEAPSHNLPQTSEKAKPAAARNDEEDELSKMAAWANS